MTTAVPDLPGPPALPLRPTPVAAARRRLRAHLGPAAVESLSAHRAPISDVLLAAFGEVLHTWSASGDCTVGRFDGERAAPLVLRRGGTFAERVTTVAEQTRETGAAAAADLPVTAVVGGTAPEPTEALRLEVNSGDDGIEVVWDVEVGRFPDGMVDAAFTAYRLLLDRLATDGDRWHAKHLDLVPEADRDLLARVNDTAAPVPEQLLHELLAASAARDPGAEAVVDRRRRLTYGELDRYANRIGARLRADGVRPGDLVAIVLPKGWEQYAAVYGVLAAGGAYLPIDPSVPAERLRLLLARGGVRVVLTRSSVSTRWPDGLRVHRVDTAFETGPAEPLAPAQRQTDPAYVIFTSGSTGEPKGVVVDHRGVVNLVTDVNARFGVGPGTRAFGISALHFDASIYDVFGLPAAGGTVVLPDPDLDTTPENWADLVRAESVTLWNSVPALLEMAVTEAEARTDRPLASLRLAVLSGDWIPLTLPDRLRAQADAVEVVGSGGPTETICWSLFYPIREVDPGWTSIPYGKAISNQRYYIVDDELRQRPVWVPGQMAVASDIGLAHGYWHDPERTAQRFVTLPETGERAYLTGDLGRLLPDGNIEILGRTDFQVKVQGLRVEPGEIEAALCRQPGVSAAVVTAPRSEHGVRRLHAFVVGDDPDEARLRDGLAEVLPSYLVPATITVLDRFPLTGNGKVDRLALTERAAHTTDPTTDTSAAAQDAGRAGGDPVEHLVCAVAADVLGLDSVEPGDNVFRLGADSFTATVIARRLKELLAVTVSNRTVLENPVLADLATALRDHPEHGEAVRRGAAVLDSLVTEAAAAGTE